MRRTRAIITAAFVVLSAAACTTPQQRAAHAIEQIGPYCEGLGFTRNTDPWRKCIQKEQARQAQIVFSDD